MKRQRRIIAHYEAPPIWKVSWLFPHATVGAKLVCIEMEPLGDTWFRSFDPANHQMSLNGAQARRDADGLYRLVIAHDDPGIANWLDTVGHRRGNITFSYVKTEERHAARLQIGMLAEILAALPGDTARVTPQEHTETIARRASAYSRRYAEPMTSRWTRFK